MQDAAQQCLLQLQVNECSDRQVPLNRFPAIYLGPNPTRNGRFNIWINTDLYTKLGMKVFTSQGALVKTTEFNGIGYGSVIPVDLSNLPSGTYHLYLKNAILKCPAKAGHFLWNLFDKFYHSTASFCT